MDGPESDQQRTGNKTRMGRERESEYLEEETSGDDGPLEAALRQLLAHLVLNTEHGLGRSARANQM